MADTPHIDGYIIERELAQGGMGVVYSAEDVRLGRKVAIKMIRRDLLLAEGTGGTEAQRDVAAARFLREARVAASIPSNHVATVLQFGETDNGDLYLVLEFLDGVSLRDVLKKDGALPPARAIHIVRQLCHGLAAAHKLGVVHRDLKPSNVMVVNQDGDRDYVKILDFGVAKLIESQEADLTQTGSMVGTHTAMAPEQIRGEDVDERTDVYASGVLLWRLLCGRSPFRGRDALAILHQHLNQMPPPPSAVRQDGLVTTSLDQVVLRCMAKNKADRIPSMLELERLLHAIAAGDEAPPALSPTNIDPRAETELFDIDPPVPTSATGSAAGSSAFRDSGSGEVSPRQSHPDEATAYLGDQHEATPSTSASSAVAAIFDGKTATDVDDETSLERPSAANDVSNAAIPLVVPPGGGAPATSNAPKWMYGVFAAAFVLTLAGVGLVLYAVATRDRTPTVTVESADALRGDMPAKKPPPVAKSDGNAAEKNGAAALATDDDAEDAQRVKNAEASPSDTVGDAEASTAPPAQKQAKKSTKAKATAKPKTKSSKRARERSEAARAKKASAKNERGKASGRRSKAKKPDEKPKASGFVRVNTGAKK